MSTPNNAVVWFELYVANMERAKNFYEAVLQQKMQAVPMPGTDLQMCTFAALEGAPGAAGALVQTPQMAPGIGGTMVYFSCADCADCAATAALVESAGGLISQPKKSIGEYGFIVIAQDTEGNAIGLHSMH